jgi:hypothetical protein
MAGYVTQLYAMADREPQQGVVDAAGVTAGARQGKAAAGGLTAKPQQALPHLNAGLPVEIGSLARRGTAR